MALMSRPVLLSLTAVTVVDRRSASDDKLTADSEWAAVLKDLALKTLIVIVEIILKLVTPVFLFAVLLS